MLLPSTIILTLLAIIITFFTIYRIYLKTTIIIQWQLTDLFSSSIQFPIILDTPGLLFISTVFIIAARVIQFSKSYIRHEKFLDRFVIIVLLFIASIIILILFPNIITLLLGWDGLGITSFVLVIYFQNPKRLGAGLITALTNRIGDVIILIAIALTLNQGHWFILSITHNMTNWAAILIITAALTKRAQMPFSSWLPAAIAAPTPVRALVHSSTLVTAGVFLLYRFYPCISLYPHFKLILTLLATLTILIAGASAMAECDIKKIIALSTLSQLGVIIFTLGVGLPTLAFFHLITHALFKALLFICAGTIIHLHSHSQDLRTIGNLPHQTPLIISSITIANLALCGMPFLAGFYSKDAIIESFYQLNFNIVISSIFIIATILTTAYSTRFTLYVILAYPANFSPQYTHETQIDINACITLTIGAILRGSVINWSTLTPISEPILSPPQKLLPLAILSIGVILGYFFSISYSPSPNRILHSHTSIWFLTPLSTHSIINPLINPPFNQLKLTDHGWNEAPQFTFNTSYTASQTISSLQLPPLTSQILSTAIILFACTLAIYLNSLI